MVLDPNSKKALSYYEASLRFLYQRTLLECFLFGKCHHRIEVHKAVRGLDKNHDIEGSQAQ